MGAAVEADNRLAMEIFQGQRGEAEAFLTLQQSLSLRPLRFGDKGDGSATAGCPSTSRTG